MSGQLASWVSEHSGCSWRGRAVLVQYALAAHPDGSPADDPPTRTELERRTGMGHNTIVAGRKEALERGELVELEAPGGRGRPGRYRVALRPLCADLDRCTPCATLAKVLPQTVRVEDGNRETVRDKDSSAAERRNRPPQRQNRPRESTNRPPRGRLHIGIDGNGDGPPSGGTVTHRESGAAPAPEGAAPEPGMSEENRARLAAYYAGPGRRPRAAEPRIAAPGSNDNGHANGTDNGTMPAAVPRQGRTGAQSRDPPADLVPVPSCPSSPDPRSIEVPERPRTTCPCSRPIWLDSPPAPGEIHLCGACKRLAPEQRPKPKAEVASAAGVASVAGVAT